MRCLQNRTGNFTVSDVAAIIDGIYRDMQTSVGIPSDSVYLFNMMIDVLGKYGEIEKARYYFEEMKRNGITPNAVSFSTIINVHLQQQVDGSQEYLDQMRDTGIKVHEVLYNTIITAWAKSGDIEQALQLMDRMILEGIHPNQATYSSIIDSLGKSGDIKQALQL
ncbi:MAG TPA: hypothetical protein VHA52_03445, partial [Candidatus Babeliaceae bacterium]|nr:hypothetical protein [Candidatus Babeliaceae bacterium]